MRIRDGWRLPATRLGAPVVLVAAGLALSAASGPIPAASHPAADEQAISPTAAMMPFAATPITIPFHVTTVVVERQRKLPPASGPIVKLPQHLDVTASAIPRRALASYVNAAKLNRASDPQCKLRWQTLAGIGFIESDNARSGGSAKPGWNGVANPPIYGPLLDGQDGFARFPDTDHGAIDGSATWDRAVGPMQFMPSTWAVWAADGNHDGIKNPQDIDDATLAAAHYLCASGPGLNRPKHLIRAIYSYNHSYSYVRAVLTVTAHYMNINPAKLGINGLPKLKKHRRVHLTTPPGAPPITPTPSGSPSPDPSGSPSPSPSPSSTPVPIPTPTRMPTPSPLPTPSAPHRPRH
jgi:membrane-bound lytic murein transglycosylase B